MEREKRFELSTLALARRCSTTELLPRAIIPATVPGLMGERGLEPPQIAPQDPKSCASTNFATRPVGPPAPV